MLTFSRPSPLPPSFFPCLPPLLFWRSLLTALLLVGPSALFQVTSLERITSLSSVDVLLPSDLPASQTPFYTVIFGSQWKVASEWCSCCLPQLGKFSFSRSSALLCISSCLCACQLISSYLVSCLIPKTEFMRADCTIFICSLMPRQLGALLDCLLHSR